MKKVIIGLIIVLVLVGLACVAEFVVFVPKASINVVGMIGDIKVGEELMVAYELRNFSLLSYAFLVQPTLLGEGGREVPLSTEKVDVEPSGVAKHEIKYTLAQEITEGKYMLRLAAFARRGVILGGNIEAARYESPFTVASKTVEATIKITGITGNKKAGGTVKINCEVANCGEVPVEVITKVKVTNTSGETELPPLTISLQPNEEKGLTTKYNIPANGVSGRYDVMAEAVSKSGDVFGTDKGSFTVAAKVTKASVNIKSIEGDKKVGNVLKIYGQVENTGETEHTFVAGLTVIDPAGKERSSTKEIKAGVNEIKPLDFNYAILQSAPVGEYIIKMSVWNGLDRNGQLFERYDEKSQQVEIRGLVTGCQLKLDVAGEPCYGGTVKISCEVTNTGEEKSNFPVLVKMKNPSAEKELINKAVTLGPAQKEAVSTDYRIASEDPDGEYKVMATAGKDADGKPLTSTEKTFKVIDRPPVISEVKGSLPTRVGEKKILRAIAEDDRGIEMMTLIFLGPGMTGESKTLMNLIAGDKKKGTWEAEIRMFTQVGDLKVTIEATDAKKQKTRSKEYKSNIGK